MNNKGDLTPHCRNECLHHTAFIHTLTETRVPKDTVDEFPMTLTPGLKTISIIPIGMVDICAKFHQYSPSNQRVITFTTESRDLDFDLYR